MKNELGQLLRKTRIAKGYSVQRFAKESGLSVATIANAELGRHASLYGKTLKAYSDVLGLDLGELVNLNEKAN